MAASGCSSASVSATAQPGNSGRHHTNGGESPSGDVSIQVGDGSGDFVYAPDMPTEVPVKVTPAGIYEVRFALANDARDAFLDRNAAITDSDGMASAILTAPSSPIKFNLRASVPGASTEVQASPSTTLTTLLVMPSYAGTRSVTAWVATADTRMKCDPHDPVPPPDGFLIGESDAPQPVPVQFVRLDVPQRITVRAGHFAGGCTDVPALSLDERRLVTVTVTDRPLQTGDVKIPVTLGIDASDAWTQGFSSLTDLMVSKAVRGSKSDTAALLDEMADATPYLWQDAFIFQRQHLGWDDRVTKLLDGGDTALRATLKRWVRTGLTSLSTSAFAGTLTSAKEAMGSASLAVTEVAGAAPADSGFPGVLALTWTSTPGDKVLFGGSATWQPSRLIGTVVNQAAKKEIASATSVSDALAKSLSCEQIGRTLADAAIDLPFLNCDAACMSSRCEEALDTMWGRARNAAVGKAAVHFAASGNATVDDTAHPVGFTGSWLGDVSLGADAIRVGGTAKGESPDAEPR